MTIDLSKIQAGSSTMQVSPDETCINGGKYLPLGINLAGIACLVVGGGRIGARKAKTLISHHAKVTVIAPELGESLQEMILAKEVVWQGCEYEPHHLKDIALVVAATSDTALNLRIAQDAESRGILSCVVSSARNSRIIFPARYERDGLTVAVHSHGKDCRRSRQIRDELSILLDNQEPENRLTLNLIGVNRNDVSNHRFRLLPQSIDKLEGEEFPVSDAIILKTCWRWECYFLSSTPRSFGGGIYAYLRDKICNISTDNKSVYYEKSGLKAYHHLLRVLLGLDSPLLGESEIVGQISSLLTQENSNSNKPLSELFASALQEQKKIRKISALDSTLVDWIEVIARHLKSLNNDRVLVVGCGKIGIALTRHLHEKGLEVISFSKRVGDSRFDSQLPSEAITSSRLNEFTELPASIILCSRLDDNLIEPLLVRIQNNKLDIIDLEGGHDSLRNAVMRGQYLSMAEIAPFINGQQAAKIARIEKNILKHVLNQHRKQVIVTAPLETIRIIGRSSELSCVQMTEVTELLKELSPKIAYQVATLLSPGDRDRKTPLPKVTEQDFFTRDLDNALLEWRADLAVHSAKDLPQPLPEGLSVAAILPSIAPWECLVSREGLNLKQLSPDARVGISSDRRRESLQALRPDLRSQDIRGNVPDRIRQMDDGNYDALILAAVGLIRLGMQDRITEIFPPAVFPSPLGQGSLALVIRSEDEELRRFLEPLNLASRKRVLCQQG